MANDVYANGNEIACKAASGKTIAAFPDVCLSPPSPPAGPIPIPYPNTACASDTTNGSKTVQIGGQEVMLKDSSTFKKSTGDEAATKSLGMGVITHQITGEASFAAWSMDVKFEGENVDRHLDMTVHNEQSLPAQTPPMVYLDRMAMAIMSGGCEKEQQAVRDCCGDGGSDDPEEQEKWNRNTRCPPDAGISEAKRFRDSFATGSPGRDQANQVLDAAYEQYANDLKENQDGCHHALKCILVSYDQGKAGLCCPPQTPDHLMPAAQFFVDGRGNTPRPGCGGYRDGGAPCVCAEGGKSTATHGLFGTARREYMDENGFSGASTWTMGQSAKCGGQAVNKVNKDCSAECVEKQLKTAHERMGVSESTPIGTEQENVRDLSGFRAEYGGGE